jgi:hypothetical protein
MKILSLREIGRSNNWMVGYWLILPILPFFQPAALSRASAAEPALVQLVPPLTNIVWVGERVRFSIELLVQGQFSGTSYFDVPEVEDAIVMRPSERPLLSSKTVDGESYVTQTHEFVLFAQRPGERTVPPITARFSSKERFDKPAVEHRLQTAPLQVKAVAPQGARPGEVVVSTTDFEATETWSPRTSQAKVGDAFTRVITMRANGVPGMLLPPLRLSRIEGLAAYPKPPQVQDRTERGDFAGERIESVTYVCERAGEFEIPEILVRWWNPKSQDWKEKRFPAMTLEVAENPALANLGPANAQNKLIPGASKPGRLTQLWPLFASVLALLFSSPWIIRRLCAARQKWVGTEPAHFARLMRACRRSDASAVDREFNLWLWRFGCSSRDPAVLLGASGDPSWSQEWLGLQRRLAGLQSDWHGGALSTQLRRLRRKLLSEAREERTAVLEPLNPVA